MSHTEAVRVLCKDGEAHLIRCGLKVCWCVFDGYWKSASSDIYKVFDAN